MELDYYFKILEIEPTGSLSVVKKAYMQLVQIYHPDRFPSQKHELIEKVNSKMKEINNAYQIIKLAIESGNVNFHFNDHEVFSGKPNKQAKYHYETHRKYFLRYTPIEVRGVNWPQYYGEIVPVSSFNLAQAYDKNGKPEMSTGVLNDKIQNSFIDNGNGTVSDIATGLMWDKLHDSEIVNEVVHNDEDFNNIVRSHIQSYFDRINGGRYCDWRIPTVVELLSLIELKDKTSNNQYIDWRFNQIISEFSDSTDLMSLLSSDKVICSSNFETVTYTLNIMVHPVSVNKVMLNKITDYYEIDPDFNAMFFWPYWGIIAVRNI